MTINEKVSYLKGLMEGLAMDESKPEAKLLKTLTDIVSDIALTLEDMQEEIDTAKDYCEELDEDLGNVESFLLGEDDDDCDCEYMEAMCPSCGESICFDNEIDAEDLICPACGKAFSEDK